MPYILTVPYLEYDDNYYNANGGVEIASNAFETREEAEIARTITMINMVRAHDVSHYNSWDNWSLITMDAIAAAFEKVFGKKLSDELPGLISADNQASALYDLFVYLDDKSDGHVAALLKELPELNVYEVSTINMSTPGDPVIPVYDPAQPGVVKEVVSRARNLDLMDLDALSAYDIVIGPYRSSRSKTTPLGSTTEEEIWIALQVIHAYGRDLGVNIEVLPYETPAIATFTFASCTAQLSPSLPPLAHLHALLMVIAHATLHHAFYDPRRSFLEAHAYATDIIQFFGFDADPDLLGLEIPRAPYDASAARNRSRQ